MDFGWNRKILGYSFWSGPGRVVKRRVASKALETMKQRVRLITKRSGGRIARNGRRWWRNSGMLIHVALPTRYFEELGLPRLAS